MAGLQEDPERSIRGKMEQKCAGRPIITLMLQLAGVMILVRRGAWLFHKRVMQIAELSSCGPPWLADEVTNRHVQSGVVSNRCAFPGGP